MSPEIIPQILELYGKNPIGERTVMQTISSLAAKLAEDPSFPSRKIIEYWSVILSACLDLGITNPDLEAFIHDYEHFFPEQLLDLFGNVPFVVEAFRILKLADPEKIKRPLAALAIVSIVTLRGSGGL